MHKGGHAIGVSEHTTGESGHALCPSIAINGHAYGQQWARWVRKTVGMPVHMQIDTGGLPVCAQWNGQVWYPPASAKTTRLNERTTCPTCIELLAHVVELALVPGIKGKRLHLENSKGLVLCRSGRLDDYRTTRLPGIVTCIQCLNAIRRITTRITCAHVAINRASFFLAGPGSRPIPTALCVACGAVIATSLCTECWGDGCDDCNGDGVVVGPRLRKYETATITEL